MSMRHFRRLPLLLVPFLALAACQTKPPPPPEFLAEPAQAEAPPPPIPAQPPMLEPQVRAEPALPAPIIVRGTKPSKASAAASPFSGDLADITLSMVDADIVAVVKATLGDVLGFPYSIDPEVTGTLTLRTNRPVTQSELIANLESALAGSGYALIYQDGRFRVSTFDRASQTVVFVEGDVPGYGTQAVQVRHVLPSTIAQVVSQYVRNGAAVSTDDANGLLMVTGPQPIRRAISDLASQFDIDSFSGKSFGVFPLSATDPETMIDELSAIFGQADPGGARSELQFVSLERMNAILVIAARAELIDQVQEWLQRLDRKDQTQEKRLFVHYVEHGEAGQIASVLRQLFGDDSSQQAKAESEGSSGPLDASGAEGGFPSSSETQPADTYMDLQPQVPQSPFPGGAPSVGGSNAGALGAGAPLEGASVSHGDIRIIADEKNNAVFVLATEQDYRLVQSAIKYLDIGLLQVLIEATIAEVSLTDSLRYGVQWFFENGNSSIRLSRVATGAVNPLFPGFGYLLAADDARIVIDALDNVTDVNVISAPEVMVLDNRVAKLQVGDEVPIATQTSISTTDPDAPIVNTIAYRNTGVILTVQPRVNSSGFVTLTIEQEVSDVVPTTTSGIDSPTFRNRRIKSSVTVKDGATIALGGLIRDSQTEGTQGIPVLSRIPVVGALFGTNTETALRTELLVLLTPRVVRNPEEADKVTHELKQRLQLLWTLSNSVPGYSE